MNPPTSTNYKRLVDYMDSCDVDYYINSDVEKLLSAVEDVTFEDLEKLDDFTWGVNVSTPLCSFRVFSSINGSE